MISRQTSAERINEIANHESVYPWICGPIEGPLDLKEPVESGDYIALLDEHGGFLFWKIADGIYDAHSIVLPEGRGRWAIKTAKAALKWMFENERASEIMMAAPKGNLAVLSLIRVLKAKFLGTIESGWWLKGQPVDCDIYSLTKTDWEKCQQPSH